jgi:hypothetical protein
MKRRAFVLGTLLLALCGFRSKKMTHDEYCVNVCGGKCCTVWDENRKPVLTCPNHGSDGRCKIFHEWKDKGTCNIQIPGTTSLPILQLVEEPEFPEWLKGECCYVHPELLEI